MQDKKAEAPLPLPRSKNPFASVIFNIPCIVGFAFFRAWWSEVMTEGTVTISPDFIHLGMSFEVFLIVSIAVLVALVFLSRKHGRFFLSSSALFIAALLAAAGTALSNISDIALLEAVFCGIGFSLISLQWGQMLLARISPNVIASLIAGFLVANILTEAMSFVPASLAVPFFSVCPFVSAMSLQTIRFQTVALPPPPPDFDWHICNR